MLTNKKSKSQSGNQNPPAPVKAGAANFIRLFDLRKGSNVQHSPGGLSSKMSNEERVENKELSRLVNSKFFVPGIGFDREQYDLTDAGIKLDF